MLMKQKFLFLLLLPGLVYFMLFRYGPMYGILLAFKEYNPHEGILGSPWVGLKYFHQMFDMKYFWTVAGNTLKISLMKILVGFPAPIIFALLLNELASNKFRRIVQTISYLPHFLSWVIVAGLIYQLVSPSYGIYGLLCDVFGWEPRVLLGDSKSFLQILLVSNVWKEIGYSSIIYLAAIAGINPEMYESAYMDGAGRFKQIIHITIPSILPTICMLFVLGLGGILDGGFDQIFNLYNSMVMPTADIIDTFVYRIGLVEMQYSFSTAVGIAKSVIALILVLSANWIVGKLSNYTIF
ncbi:ABC transporter permease subunit [Paenibacillus sp. HWE-109]|uniref:ABC transporter permease n=1 Tax=Paenibacillus sp. HWE-109 TaxID=1306526 RepID=UPI001EDE1F67|nr:ABC transporter permease subunit [Paenibacillus sp. HWE-109]UKS29479.1 ABC transporter permease subunit [Paenibacillus sp. HWE-109]